MPATAFLGERPTGQLAGVACAPHSTDWEEVVSMVDGSPLGSLPLGTPADLAEAAQRVRDAQRAWGALPAWLRLAGLRRFAGLLATYRDPAAEVVRAETGLTLPEVAELVARSGPQCRRLARTGVRRLRPVRHGWRPRVLEHHEPRGVVGIVPDPAAPFDPETAVAALVAGNGVVFVPGLRSGFTALLLTRLLVASRLPAGLVQAVPGAPELAEAAAEVVDQLVVGPGVPAAVPRACARHGVVLASGPRTDPLDFTVPVVVRR